MNYKSLLLTGIVFLFLSCQFDLRKINKSSKSKIEEKELNSGTVNDSSFDTDKIDTVTENTSNNKTQPLEFPANDYILHTYYPYSDYRPTNRYLLIPYIIRNEKEFYNIDEYPSELIIRLVPTKIDTLEVISGTGDYPTCLDIIKIQDKDEVELFYRLSVDDTTVAQKGILDTILAKRGISVQELWDNSYIETTIPNWKNIVNLDDCLNTYYILPTFSKLNKNLSIESIKKQILNNNDLNTYSLDTLKALYAKYLNTEDTLKIENCLSEYKGGYFHSGGISTDIEGDVLLLIESLNIIYISKQNEIFKVEWLSNYTTILNKYSLFDDNYAEIIDNHYQINDWGTGRTTCLFNSQMDEDDYLVVYELKLKYIDTYIHSPIEILTYKKPNKEELPQ